MNCQFDPNNLTNWILIGLTLLVAAYRSGMLTGFLAKLGAALSSAVPASPDKPSGPLPINPVVPNLPSGPIDPNHPLLSELLALPASLLLAFLQQQRQQQPQPASPEKTS